MSNEKMKAERAEQWREQLRKDIKAKDRTSIERVAMPEEDPTERAKLMDAEVNKGLSANLAINEAKRCMDCANPTCMEGCPVNINIPKFIKQIEVSNFLGAAATLKETSALPAVCGRVCPQEKQCEAQCFYIQKLHKEPVAIGYLERFAADYERASKVEKLPAMLPPNGIKVATVGSGPAALAFAGDMAKLGYDVTVYEALHEVGGVLKYGIPEFRLPNQIVDFELSNLEKMGVKFERNFIVGRTSSFKELQDEGIKAFFVSSGAGLPRFMNIPGENANGVMSANEYLTRVNLMSAGRSVVDTPVLKAKNVAIIGGGNTAMDSVRTAKRMGAERAMIVYRRSMDEMPARAEEIHHAIEEGVEFLNLSNPVAYEVNEEGRVCSMRLQKMELGEPDESGRRRPIVIEGAEENIPVDMVIIAIGVSPNPLVPKELPQLEVSKWGTIIVNEENMQSSIPWVFAGGDIVRGGATVILAMGDGRKAAEGMHKYLSEN